jgi:hypothetical protein
MNINNAKWANSEHTAVIVNVDSKGDVLIDLESETDNSEGLRNLFNEWYFTHAPEDYVEAIPALSRKQLRLMLLNLGISSTSILAIIESIQDPIEKETALINWEESSYYERSHPLVNYVGQQLELSSIEIDNAFRSAANL